MHKKIVGIDYGAKMAGTTVMVWNDGEILHWAGTSKNQDADKWLEKELISLHPEWVFIDAPLSLPGVYTGNGEDYFYREGDKLLQAMSPMFLGGLTARAMRLKNQLDGLGMQVFETYPVKVVTKLGDLKSMYLKKNKTALPEFLLHLEKQLPLPWTTPPESWHGADAFLAWMGGYRHTIGIAENFGNEQEGLIWI
ncbi:MAG: hypothetical protein KDC24_01445 [Saprospiraceae bacterium]|nr:hypothetical protein [Saprospiraceae bacterium]